MESSFSYVPATHDFRILTCPFPLIIQTGLFSATVALFLSLTYPNLQRDPNDTTQSILTHISQQLANGTIPAVNPSIQTSFSPPTSVIFINSVWYLSLVLSLTCALMATLLQQWARNYFQKIERKYAPIHHARIHEYFSMGAHKSGMFGFAEVLPLLLHLSVFLFFAGLVVFTFRGNHVVAYVTVAVVGFSTLSYIFVTLLPFFSLHCPYHTPSTYAIWFSAQTAIRAFFSALYSCANQLHLHWRIVSESRVKTLSERQKNKASMDFLENTISKLENSTGYISMDMDKQIFEKTLHWLNKDHELEEFAAGIPGLYESEAFTYHGEGKSDIRSVLAALPGAANSQLTLSWRIIQLAQRAITSNLSGPIQQRRIKTCLRALYYIPGAIRDILASYEAGKRYCLEILPLLNSPESLEIIDELWDSPNDDVSLSVRCVAAVVAAFMITPPHFVLEYFLPPDVRVIRYEDVGRQFLANRLRDGHFQDQPRGDSARLQNIIQFLKDIRHAVGFMTTRWWTADIAISIQRESRELSKLRHSKDYSGRGIFSQHGNRASPEFVPAAQRDLITLTLEILAQDTVATVPWEQSEAFREECRQLEHVVFEHARREAALPQKVTRGVASPLALIQMQATDTINMVKLPLKPVLASLR